MRPGRGVVSRMGHRGVVATASARRVAGEPAPPVQSHHPRVHVAGGPVIRHAIVFAIYCLTGSACVLVGAWAATRIGRRK